MEYYELSIAGLSRKLPKIEISDEITIASFVILGDVEIVKASAKALKDKIPPVDYIVTAEAKGIPLAYELAKQLGMDRYIVIRKSIKAYMNEPISTSVESITTSFEQNLFLDGQDIDLIVGKKVAIVDDVISSGKSIEALESLITQAGAEVVTKAAILAEGDAMNRDDIIYLEKLPIFQNR